MPGAAVVNTSPLIFLAKLGRLEALSIFKPVLTTPEALSEVLAGLPEGFRDALAVQAAVDQGAIEVRKAPPLSVPPLDLGRGEVSVLGLARRVSGVTVVVDDLPAIKAAKGLGLRVRSTPFVLLDNVDGGGIGVEEFRGLVDQLVGLGYHISPQLYLRLRDEGKRR